MRLTVGPLPPAVYWRRRGIVLAGLLIVVLLVSYACSGSTKSGATGSRTQAAATSSPDLQPEPSETPTLLTPVIDDAASSPSAAPSSAPSNAPASAPAVATGPCTDAEIMVTPVPEVPSARVGVAVKFTLKIKNVSTRACPRDVGADMQELYLQAGGAKVWSSDACDRRRGSDVVSLPPNHEVAYYVIWDGKTTAKGCANRPFVARGAYQLVGRLGTRVSEPVTLTVS
jgi:hypothetical protein